MPDDNIYSTEYTRSFPRSSGKERVLAFSLALSLAVHAGCAALYVFLPFKTPQIHLMLRTGEEALDLAVAPPVLSAPAPPAQPVPEQRPDFAEEPERQRLTEEKPVSAAALPQTASGIFLSTPGPDRIMIETTEAEMQPLRDRQPHNAAREKRIARAEPDVPAEAAAQPQPALAGAAAAMPGAAPKPRGVRQRPQPLAALLPLYPESSRRLGEEGEVVVRVLIDSAGACVRAQVEQSSAFAALDNAALDTVRRARYRPGTEDGSAAAMEDVFVIEFRLE